MKVSLYLLNDNVHSFDEVVSMCRKYLSYPTTQGMSIANIVHTSGECRIYEGSTAEELYEVFREDGFNVELRTEYE